MDELVVSLWVKYGHRRVYVATAAGETVGYLDLNSGQAVLDRPELAVAFQEALAAADAPVVAKTPPAPPAAVTEPASVPPAPEPASEPEWVDLAANRPGQAARQQADTHLAAMREKSRLGTALARALDVKTDERAWRVGAEGEEAVGPRLEKLTAHGWHVLHAVLVGTKGGDIDHVLVGPGGVFTVNTKTHRGKSIWVSPTQVRVNGYRTDYLRESRREADRARKLLTESLGWEPPVKAALVFLTGTVFADLTIKGGGPEDVAILERMDLPRVFRRAPARLTPEGVAEVFEVARRSITWSG